MKLIISYFDLQKDYFENNYDQMDLMSYLFTTILFIDFIIHISNLIKVDLKIYSKFYLFNFMQNYFKEKTMPIKLNLE